MSEIVKSPMKMSYFETGGSERNKGNIFQHKKMKTQAIKDRQPNVSFDLRCFQGSV